MTNEELERVTEYIIENVARNGYYLHMKDDDLGNGVRASEVIFSLHNLLFKEVNGEEYDYWFHWTNKEGIDGLDEHIFERNDDNDFSS